MSSNKSIEGPDSDRLFDTFNSRYFGQRHSSSTLAPAAFSFFLDLPKELRLKIWTCHLRRHRFLRVLLEENTAPQVSTSAGNYDPQGPEMGSSTYYDPDDSEEDEWSALFSAEPQQPEGINETSKTTRENPDPFLHITFLGAPTSPMPALPLVCRESYNVYRSFYRVLLPSLARVPSEYREVGYKTVRIIAHLNPDLDTLSLETPELKVLPFFLHTFLQCDSSPAPVRFGVRNLCVDLTRLGSDYHSSSPDGPPDGPPDDVLASVRITVPHLRNLYLRLMTTSDLEPRVMSGPLMVPGSLPWYNASVPVLPAPSWDFPGTVELVDGDGDGGDPRLTRPEGAADLRQVWISNQVRPSLDAWARQERAWGVRAGGADVSDGGGSFQVRALVALAGQALASRSQRGRQVSSIQAGTRGPSPLKHDMREERAAWLALMDPTTDIGQFRRDLFQTAQQRFLLPDANNVDTDDGLAGIVAPEEWILRRQPHTAVGFWLVDPEALEIANTKGYVGKRVVDLSEMGREAIQLWAFGGHS